MGKPRFPFPVSVHEIVSLLNASDAGWSLTVLQDHNTLYVFDGDQALFVARDRQEAVDFLAGVFLATFHGQSLDRLRVERDQRNVPPDNELDDIRAGLSRFGNLKPAD
jgi:hypothetical protein